jgi:DNA-3-methyladenine glycosylase
MPPGSLIERSFLERAPDLVAPDVLGKLLARRVSGTLLAGRIVEVEAYFGQDDPAAHAAAGPTARNAVLFGPAGHAYVYFIYGMYSCLNISCELEGQAGSVLVRALEPLAGLTQMTNARGLAPSAAPRLLTSGPGRLCQAFGLTRATHNGFVVPGVVVTPRIGISKAAERPLRYSVDGNPCVSGPKRLARPIT